MYFVFVLCFVFVLVCFGNRELNNRVLPQDHLNPFKVSEVYLVIYYVIHPKPSVKVKKKKKFCLEDLEDLRATPAGATTRRPRGFVYPSAPG